MSAWKTTSKVSPLAVVCVIVLTGCVQEMADQPRVDVWESPPQSALLRDERRAPVAGTVARGHLAVDDVRSNTDDVGQFADAFPMPVESAILERGRERYGIYCTPCHGLTGNGDGSVVQRGFPRPPTYHMPRLREAAPGHFFDVISNGRGRMPRFSDRIPRRDRWAIVAYIRALQLSQHVRLEELSEDARNDILKQLP